MPSYLQKRRRLYYAVLEIPKPLRAQFAGKARFVRSLETDSLTVARRRVGPIVAAWLAELERAKGVESGPVEQDAAFFRKALHRAAGTGDARDVDGHPTDDRTLMLDLVYDRASEIEYIQGRSEAEAFYRTAMAIGTGDHIEEYLAQAPIGDHTLATHRTDLLRFAAKFPTLSTVRKPAMKRWTVELVEQGLSPKTVQRIMSPLRSWWRYLQTIEVVSSEAEPFAGLDVGRQSKRAGQRLARRPFTGPEVVRLWEAARSGGDQTLADLIMLAAYTGARIGELCQIRTGDVDLPAATTSIRYSKTNAGVRVAPTHSALAATLARLVAGSSDGFVVTGQTVDKYGERTNAVSHRFRKLLKRLKLDRGVSFHSLRRTFITELERAGVAEPVVQDIVGHERSTLTGSTYSGKSTLAMKREAIERLAYPWPTGSLIAVGPVQTGA